MTLDFRFRANHNKRLRFLQTMVNTAMKVLSFLLLAASSAMAFVTPSLTTTKAPSSLEMADAPTSPPVISYGEESRKYRRTVFTHEDWKRYRDPSRFQKGIGTMFVSGIYKSLSREVTATTAMATLVVLYNMAFGGYTDFEGVQHAALSTSLPVLGLPLSWYTLSSPRYVVHLVV